VRRWLRLDTETRELRLVLTDLFDGRHTRAEYRCIGDEGRALRGHRWAHLEGTRVDYDAASGHYWVLPGAFSTLRVWLDLEPRPAVDERVDCRLFDRRGERAVRNRNRACPHCREADGAWEATA
jgi:hypothetical protein